MSWLRKMVRWMARGLGAVALLIVVAMGVLYAASVRGLERHYESSPRNIAVQDDSATVAHGERMARIHGCVGCHESDLGGGVMADDFMVGRLVAPNLTRVREEYLDGDFVRLIRHGVRPDGTSVTPAMPSQSFQHLADDDLGAIIAYVRSVQAVEDSMPRTRIGPALRAMIALGEVSMTADMIEPGRAPERAPRDEDPEVLGAYLALSICTECHGTALEGTDGFMVTPSLAIVGSYDPEQFRKLMREGLALGDRDVGVMSDVARGRFSHYTDQEIDALYAYLSTLGGR